MMSKEQIKTSLKNLEKIDLGCGPQICIPKSGDTLLVHIERHRYLIIIGRLVISSVSGIWLRRK